MQIGEGSDFDVIWPRQAVLNPSHIKYLSIEFAITSVSIDTSAIVSIFGHLRTAEIISHWLFSCLELHYKYPGYSTSARSYGYEPTRDSALVSSVRLRCALRWLAAYLIHWFSYE
jgi:hypothetical protein